MFRKILAGCLLVIAALAFLGSYMDAQKIKLLVVDGKEIDVSNGLGSYFEIAPPAQKFLRDEIKKIQSKVENLDNDARKKKEWIDFNKFLCSNKNFGIKSKQTNWIGTFKEIKVLDSGKMQVYIKIDDIGNSIFSVDVPKKLEFLIDTAPKTPVRFSGRFDAGKLSENECISAVGFVSDPVIDNESFYFKLTDLKTIGNYKEIEKSD